MRGPLALVARVVRKGARRVVVGSILALTICAAQPASSAETLRVCADPDNLPFSRAEGPERGLYVELAELVASRLGLRPEYAWFISNYGRRAVRSTLLADRCDPYFGLPDDAEFMGRRVAVQFGTTPQLLLATRPGFTAVTFRLAEEAMEALTRGEADVAFLWGPTAGYFNKTRLGGAYAIVPVAGEGLQWQVAVGVRNGQDSLKADLDRVLDQLKPEITTLADKYGFPRGRPVGLDGQRGGLDPSEYGAGALQLAQHQETTTRQTSPSGAPADDFVRLGRSLFNQHCSHCHAPNAMSPEPSRDLRRLALRYGARMRETAYTTITAGRIDKGMPAWKDLLGEEGIQNVIGFLESVQRVP